MGDLVLNQGRDSSQNMMEVAQSRAVQEVQAAMVIAKKCPRDEQKSEDKILKACERASLAEQAIYEYAKGGTKIEGPSIRLAETMARSWQNMDFGVVELSQDDGESQVMAYAWDLENNVKQTKIFTVSHRFKSHGSFKTVDDPREVYELVANQGARRLRACILGIIPGDIQEKAVERCKKTLLGDSSVGTAEKITKMADAFKEFGVTKEMLEVRLQHKLDATTPNELAKLRQIYQSLKDGMSGIGDWFQEGPAPTQGRQPLKETDPPVGTKPVSVPQQQTPTAAGNADKGPGTSTGEPGPAPVNGQQAASRPKRTYTRRQPVEGQQSIGQAAQTAMPPTPPQVLEQVLGQSEQVPADHKVITAEEMFMIPPETVLICNNGHTMEADKLVNHNGVMVCPRCSSDDVQVDPRFNAQPEAQQPAPQQQSVQPEAPKTEMWTCSKGHFFGKAEIIPTPLAGKVSPGKCPRCSLPNIQISPCK